MAVAGIKLATESGFPTNCFPARYRFGRTSSDGSGAWTVAYEAEEKRRFKAVLCAEPRTYSRIKEERRKAEIRGNESASHKSSDAKEKLDYDAKVLNKSFLLSHCCVGDPSDLCSVNIAGMELTDVNQEELSLFENVAYINAAENFLSFETFSGFPSLRELEVPLSGLQNLKISHTDFTNLEVLDVSYNNLSQDDIMALGLLSRLKVLYLTGNNFSSLPQDLAMPYLSREKQVCLQRFASLEVLLLDDNKLMDMSVFAALASLPKLRHLDLSRNEIFYVPQLKLVEGRVVTQDGMERRRTKRSGSRRNSNRRHKSASLREKQIKPETCMGEVGNNASQSLLFQDDNSTKEDRLTSGDESRIKDREDTGDESRIKDTEATDDESRIEDGVEKHNENSLKTAEVVENNFSTRDLSACIRDFVSENEELQFPVENPQLPPFAELRYLNLADNKIGEEDGLLALAAWPMLEEADIFNNPLNTQSSGDPPLLRNFLQDRLGIRLNRIKPRETSGCRKKGKGEIRPKYRKITHTVPKVPKIPLEHMMKILQLSSSHEHKPAELIPASYFTDIQKEASFSISNNKPVLPPIPTAVEEEVNESQEQTTTYQEGEETQVNGSEEEQPREDNSDPFFITQVNEIEEKLSDQVGSRLQTENRSPSESRSCNESRSPFVDPENSEITKSVNNMCSQSVSAIDNRYKGYELLLDIEDLENEPDLPPANDILGNIKALKHTLNHILIYRDPAVELNKVKKMVQEYRRVPVTPPKPHRTYQQKVDDLLTQLRTRSTIEEENLATVLKDKKRFHKKFPEAKNLLQRIEKRYSSVRHNLIMDAKQAVDIAADVLELLPHPQTKNTV